MAALSPAEPTWPIEPVKWYRRNAARNFLERKLRPSIAVHDAAGHITAAGHSHGERINRDRGLHPITDRVADDPVGPDVLDRALVQLAAQEASLRCGLVLPSVAKACRCLPRGLVPEVCSTRRMAL